MKRLDKALPLIKSDLVEVAMLIESINGKRISSSIALGSFTRKPSDKIIL